MLDVVVSCEQHHLLKRSLGDEQAVSYRAKLDGDYLVV